jgi:hypothetical protein
VNPLVILAIGNALVWGGLIPILLSWLARDARRMESDLERLEGHLSKADVPENE